MSKVVTNATFANTDQAFRAACKKAGIPVTTRQASKWRNKFGAAWTARK
jgi:hypothetical protein